MKQEQKQKRKQTKKSTINIYAILFRVVCAKTNNCAIFCSILMVQRLHS